MSFAKNMYGTLLPKDLKYLPSIPDINRKDNAEFLSLLTTFEAQLSSLLNSQSEILWGNSEAKEKKFIPPQVLHVISTLRNWINQNYLKTDRFKKSE